MNRLKERGASAATTVVLIVVIVVAIGAIIFQLKKSGGGGGSAASDAVNMDFICTDSACGSAFKVEVQMDQEMEYQMGGKKMKCDKCGKESAVVAMPCPNCKAVVPSPGMAAMEMMMGGQGQAPVCPKCKKPMVAPPPTE